MLLGDPRQSDQRTQSFHFLIVVHQSLDPAAQSSAQAPSSLSLHMHFEVRALDRLRVRTRRRVGSTRRRGNHMHDHSRFQRDINDVTGVSLSLYLSQKSLTHNIGSASALPIIYFAMLTSAFVVNEYSLVPWNWSSDVTGCMKFRSILWRQRTNFTAAGCIPSPHREHGMLFYLTAYTLAHRVSTLCFYAVRNLSKLGTYGGNDSIVAFARNNKVDVVIHQHNAPRLHVSLSTRSRWFLDEIWVLVSYDFTVAWITIGLASATSQRSNRQNWF